jgi:hypothetical protein
MFTEVDGSEAKFFSRASRQLNGCTAHLQALNGTLLISIFFRARYVLAATSFLLAVLSIYLLSELRLIDKRFKFRFGDTILVAQSL